MLWEVMFVHALKNVNVTFIAKVGNTSIGGIAGTTRGKGILRQTSQRQFPDGLILVICT